MDTHSHDKGFAREFAGAVKDRIISEIRDEREHDMDAMRNWRAWGSWFSWGSPIGLGLFVLSIGGFLVLLHLANIIK